MARFLGVFATRAPPFLSNSQGRHLRVQPSPPWRMITYEHADTVSQPPPVHPNDHQFNSQYDYSTFDYSMTNPLLPDGSNFPCKGYAGDVPGVSHAVDTLTAGQSYTVKLARDGATHSGGSCQFSLS